MAPIRILFQIQIDSYNMTHQWSLHIQTIPLQPQPSQEIMTLARPERAGHPRERVHAQAAAPPYSRAGTHRGLNCDAAAAAPASASRSWLIVKGWPPHPRGQGPATVLSRVYLIDKLKISEVGDKREYRIYRNSIGDREIFSDKI